jgi:hypothetical protein
MSQGRILAIGVLAYIGTDIFSSPALVSQNVDHIYTSSKVQSTTKLKTRDSDETLSN